MHTFLDSLQLQVADVMLLRCFPLFSSFCLMPGCRDHLGTRDGKCDEEDAVRAVERKYGDGNGLHLGDT